MICIFSFFFSGLKIGTKKGGGPGRAFGGGGGVYRVLVGKPEGKNHLGEPGIDGRIILRWIFRKWDVGLWTGSSWLRIGRGGGHL